MYVTSHLVLSGRAGAALEVAASGKRAQFRYRAPTKIGPQGEAKKESAQAKRERKNAIRMKLLDAHVN